MAFEFVGVIGQSDQIGDPVAADAPTKHIVESQSAQGCEAPGAAPAMTARFPSTLPASARALTAATQSRTSLMPQAPRRRSR